MRRREIRWARGISRFRGRGPTALLKDDNAYVQAGDGWVNDSTPEGEFPETVNKFKAMLKAVAVAESFAREA